MYQTEEMIASVTLCCEVVQLQLVRVGEPEGDTDIGAGVYMKTPEQYDGIQYDGPLSEDQVAAFFALFPDCTRM